MNTLPTFLKRLRKASSLTQPELAEILGVSTVLISMIESGQKRSSLKFINTLAKKLKVHPGAIAPLAFNEVGADNEKISSLKRELLKIGNKLQNELIDKKAKYLKK